MLAMSHIYNMKQIRAGYYSSPKLDKKDEIGKVKK